MSKIWDYLGWSIIFLTGLGIISFYGMARIDRVRQQAQIEAYVNQGPESQEKSPYFGYIRFPQYQVERLIRYGDPNQVVDASYIGIFGSVPKDLQVESLLLVGHSRTNLFSVLHHLQLRNEVELYHQATLYHYEVVKRKIIRADDSSFLKEITDPMLVLITCLNDNQKRLILFCKLNRPA